jgi:hypothetical protein
MWILYFLLTLKYKFWLFLCLFSFPTRYHNKALCLLICIKANLRQVVHFINYFSFIQEWKHLNFIKFDSLITIVPSKLFKIMNINIFIFKY